MLSFVSCSALCQVCLVRRSWNNVPVMCSSGWVARPAQFMSLAAPTGCDAGQVPLGTGLREWLARVEAAFVAMWKRRLDATSGFRE